MLMPCSTWACYCGPAIRGRPGRSRPPRREHRRHEQPRGDNRSTDPAGARRWWEEAAKAGNARAMSNLATLLKDSDPRKARYWGEKAKSTLLS